MTIKEELALVAEAQAGQREAVGALWENITPKLYGYLVNVLRDPVLAEDILQNTWLKAVGALPKFQAQGVRFSAWLFAIAKNECRSHWRDRKHETSLPEEDLDGANNITQRVNAPTADNVLIDQIIGKLSPDDQEILRLRYIAELSFNEISAVMNVSLVGARVRIHRALGRARAIANNQ